MGDFLGANCLDKTFTLGIGLGAAALGFGSATVAPLVVTGLAGVAAVTAARALKNGLEENVVARAAFIAAVTAVQKRYQVSGAVPDDMLIQFGGEFDRCVDRIDLPINDLSRLAELGGTAATFPKALATPMVEDLCHHSNWINTTPALKALAQEILEEAIRAGLNASQSLQLEILTTLLNRTLSDIAVDGEKTRDVVRHETAALSAKVDRLTATLDANGGIKAALNANVKEAAIIGLAKRVANDVDNFDQAYAQLEALVKTEIEVQKDGQLGKDVGDLVGQVLAEIAALSAEGRNEEAAQTADVAFTNWKKDESVRQESAKQHGIAFLDAGLKQDMLRRDPVSAARRLSQKTALEQQNQRSEYEALCLIQSEYFARGRDMGSNFELAVSISLTDEAFKTAEGRDERGALLDRKANSLSTLGMRETDNERLHESVLVYRAALIEIPRSRNPVAWAAVQNNLGVALNWLGQRKGDVAILAEAIAVFRLSLTETTRFTAPLDWASTQTNLGVSLSALGELNSDIEMLNRAVEVYSEILQVFTRESAPLNWALVQNNLGNVLKAIGVRRGSIAFLEAAASAYRQALLERLQARVPFDWAATQNNLGNVLRDTGEINGDVKVLQEAASAYYAALSEYTQEQMPMQWAVTQRNLGSVFVTLSERSGDVSYLRDAISVCRAALNECHQNNAPIEWAAIQLTLGNALRMFGECQQDVNYIFEGVTAYFEAIKVYSRISMPLDWAVIQVNLGNAFKSIGPLENHNSNLQKAVVAYVIPKLSNADSRGIPMFSGS
jgi:tetratricopeptide (TPR) repeat protein